MDIPAGLILDPPNLGGWGDFPICDALRHHAGLPVTFVNDGTAAAYGEYWVGGAQAYNSLVLLTLGTGIGGGIIINDAPLHGEHSHGETLVLQTFRRAVKFPQIIWADQAYAAVVSWGWIKWLWLIEIVRRPRGKFKLQPKCWIVERILVWLNRSRRLSKSFERTPESDAAFVHGAMIHLMVKRRC